MLPVAQMSVQLVDTADREFPAGAKSDGLVEVSMVPLESMIPTARRSALEVKPVVGIAAS